MLLEISQNSQKNICARVSFLIKLKKKLWHRCFPVNFATFLRTPFLQNTSGRLLLEVFLYYTIYIICIDIICIHWILLDMMLWYSKAFLFFLFVLWSNRNSLRRCSVKRGVHRNFTKFTGKRLCQSLFFNKVAGLSLQLYWKRDSGTDVFL